MDRWMDHEAPGVQEVSTTMKIPGPPAWVSTQVCRRLQHLPRIAPPRVCAAALRTLFNGWCTERRFQRIGSAADQCWLGCGEGGHDSIEHYCRCPLGIDVLREKLNIFVPRRDAMQLWMLGHAAQESDDILALGALFVYGVYMTTNYYRHHGYHNTNQIKECLKQHIIQGCQGHAGLATRLGACWTRPATRL